MKKAIYFRLITLTFIAILICSFISAMIYAVYTENQTKEWLTRLTLSTAENYKHSTDVLSLSGSAGNNRVTIIAPDGRVLADSETAAAGMENHADREEVKYARAGGVYIAMRTSNTLGVKFMYASIKTADGNILRLAHRYSGLLHNLAVQLPAILIAGLIALVLSLFLANRFSRAVTNPLEKVVDALTEHDYGRLAGYASPYYEIDKIMQSIQVLLAKISESNQSIISEREKTSHILANMAEGFILVDSKKNILLCNKSANTFLGGGQTAVSQNILTLFREQRILDAVDNALINKRSSIFDMQIRDDLIVNVYISPLQNNDFDYGATILLVDMTSERQLEKQKRDFFSNASHELKTPITSILGFSEMLNSGIIKSEAEKTEVLQRVETEARRMSGLISDILMISNLESKTETPEYEDFNFSDVIREAAGSVLPLTDSRNVEMDLDLNDVTVHANKRQLYEMCVNLIENAVKYNKPDGRVSISLVLKDEAAVFTIEDTGIGIPLEYQSRVFERFFRVDYGRDKKAGGTGLGLSIVKHIVNIYDGEITLQSKMDAGTAIQISLPKIPVLITTKMV